MSNKGKSKKKWIILVVAVLLLIPIVIVVGIFALVGGGLYFGTKSTEEFTCAMEKIRSHKESIEVLGEPIEDGYLILPNINISGSKRDVQFSVPVSGSKGEGSLSVVSFRDGFRSDFAMFLTAGDKKIQIHKGTYPCG